jgi:hypothetical protein
MRQLALAGQGVVCLADFMTVRDRAQGTLVQVLPQATVLQRQAIHAVYYRNTALAARITAFLDFLAAAMVPPTDSAGSASTPEAGASGPRQSSLVPSGTSRSGTHSATWPSAL